MNQPTLVIMAAGMGSRFGGPKQITPVDSQGHIIIDFSLFDAWRAGFRKVAFIIKKEMEADFREVIGDRMEKYFEVSYIYQELTRLPEGYTVPDGRSKPWGTGHAVACCKGVVDGPFAVINADDFYGPTAFSTIYDYLASNTDDSAYAMVGYRLRNTVTEFGSVARGVCEVADGKLTNITERTKIYKRGDDAAYTEDDGQTFTDIAGDTIVSMNLWGFSGSFIDQLWSRFPTFLDKNLPVNPLKCEYFLPFVVDEQIKDGSASVSVLPCEETWYGVTYREDLESVQQAIADMKVKGIYKEDLWA
ncbi:MAG: nucleotidyltransferase [Clostridia bacterium]|nr:nucleotidyltransferase [Clostridia bacterium]